MGCYKDDTKSRDLNGLSENPSKNEEGSIEACIMKCQEKKFEFAGIQAG